MRKPLRSIVKLVNILVVVSLISSCGVIRRRLLGTSTPQGETGGGEGATTSAPITNNVPILVGTPVPVVPLPVLFPSVSTGWGVLVVIPGGSGSTSDAASIAAVASVGPRYMRVAFEWDLSEPQAGQLSFNTQNDSEIAAIEGAGLRVFPTIYVGRGWMNGNPPDARSGGSRSFPPNDLGTVWNAKTGYSPTYYNFVYQFFSHYKGHFDYAAIENEANSKLFWGGTIEEYVRVLKTAYKAIKDADPHVVVTDSGFVASAWGVCIADYYISHNVMGRDQALQLAVTFYAAESRTGNRPITTPAEVERYLGRAQVKEQCRRYNYVLDNVGGSVDALNFHFYEDYNALSIVTDFLRLRAQKTGIPVRVVTNEIGQRGPDVAYAEGADQAKAVFKKMVTAQVVGLEAAVWFSADTVGTAAPSPDKVGLFGSGGVLRPAAGAFKLVAQTMAGYKFKSALSNGPALYHYIFDDTAGKPTLEALWTEGGGQAVGLKAPQGSTQAIVTDYAGKTQTLAVSNGSASLTLTDAPVFVQWK